MLCERCGEKQATVHMTQIDNHEKREVHLCQECAQHYDEFLPGFSINFDFSNMLASLFEQSNIWGKTSQPTVACSNCNQTLADIQRIGELGCSGCYETFKNEINPLLRRIHGSTRHVGKFLHSVCQGEENSVRSKTFKNSYRKLLA